MSDTQDIEARILGRPPAPGWGRPPTGVWPPCPPGPSGPWPGGLFRLEQCWDDVKATRALLTRIIKDILADDPSIIGLAQPIIGVTDGTDAQPGQVGEWKQFAQNINFTAPPQTQVVTMGVLPPGDWDVWAWAYVAVGTTGINIGLDPVPPGFSTGMQGFLVDPTQADVLLTPTVRALTSAPSLIAFQILTNQAAAGPAAGSFPLYCLARRRR